MKKGMYLIICCMALLLSSCEIEPFEGDSLSAEEGSEIPMPADNPDFPEELPEDEEEPDPETEFTTGELRYEIGGRSLLTIENNAAIDGDRTTVVGIDKMSGERVIISFVGNAAGLYIFDQNNSATYHPDFLQFPFLTPLDQESGFVDISRYDLQQNQIDGIFQFVAFRAIRDAEGNTILDPEDNPALEEVEIINGEFEMIPLN